MAKVTKSPDVVPPEVLAAAADVVSGPAVVVDENALALELAQQAIAEEGPLVPVLNNAPRVTFQRQGPNNSTEVCDSATGEVVDRWFNDEPRPA
jgi:hypothetical protein